MPSGVEEMPWWIALPVAIVLLVINRRQVVRDRRAIREMNQ